MARKASVWWWKARKCWACTIDGKRVTDKSGIDEDDIIGANQWWKAIRGRESAVPYGTHTVEDLCEEYGAWDKQRVQDEGRDARSHRAMLSRLRAVCMTRVSGEFIKDMRATHVTHETLRQATAAWSRKGLMPTYRYDLGSALLAVFRWSAKTHGGQPAIIAENPLAGYRLPMIPPGEEKYAERGEAAAWLHYLRRSGADPNFILLQRCLIHTGARPSEWTGARVREINWSAKPMPILTRTKWKNSRKTGKVRRVYIPQRLARAVRRAIEKKGASDRIFSNSRGTGWTAETLARATKTHRDQAIAANVGIVAEGSNRLTCYRWRHTAASNLLMADVNIATVAQLLGTSVEHIAKTYGHIQADHLAAAAQRATRPRLQV